MKLKDSDAKEVVVLTVDSSPYCFQLHAAANQALFITKAEIPIRHIVIVESDVFAKRSKLVYKAKDVVFVLDEDKAVLKSPGEVICSSDGKSLIIKK